MKIPSSGAKREQFCEDIIEQCNYSQPQRVTKYKQYESLRDKGSMDGAAATYNKCYTHVDKRSSMIYSPAEIRFSLEFEDEDNPTWEPKLRVTAKHLNRQFHRRGLHTLISQGVEWSQVYGCMLFKSVWTNDGIAGHLIKPSSFGVWNEELTDINTQEAFVHTMRVSRSAVRRLLYAHPTKDSLLKKLESASTTPSMDQQATQYDVIANGIGQLGSSAGSGGGNVFPRGGEGSLQATISPDVERELVDLYEIWVQDDDRQDWTTLRYVKPGILLEGLYQSRSLCDFPHGQPFTKITAKETPGYFFCESELERVARLQTLLNDRISDVDTIWDMQVRPPRSITGDATVTEEKILALLAPGGYFTSSEQGAKISEHKPDMPSGALEYLKHIESMFDEAGGFNAMLSGQGDSGVRAGNHAQSLLRMSGPRIRDAAIEVETQVSEIGDNCLRILQAKSTNIFKDDQGGEFLLAQIPDDAYVVVDSHTTSPIFSGENQNLAFALAKAGAIDGEALLEMVHPARTEELVTKLRKRKAQEAQFIQQHPEMLAKGKGRGK